MTAAEIGFWLAACVVTQIYIGYPVGVALRARWAARPVKKGPFAGRFDVLIACHGEEAKLAAKLDSVMRQTAASHLGTIFVGLDGAAAIPSEMAGWAAHPQVRVIPFPERRGKPAVLNDLMPRSDADIVVMADARQRLAPDAVERLLSCFHDPSVGVVSGELVFEAEGAASVTGQGMGVYWRYEKWIRNNEGRVGSVPGATGALYAIRRSHLRPIPPQTLLDDVAIPMQAVVAGGRCLFEEGAHVFDAPSRDARQESIRKRRTIAGVAQLCHLYPDWLNPFRNPAWAAFFFHKVLRLASPVALAVLAIAPWWLLEKQIYSTLLVAQGVFYAVAFAGWLREFAGRPLSGVLSAPMLFTALNLTTCLALGDAMRGRYRVTWKRSAEQTGATPGNPS